MGAPWGQGGTLFVGSLKYIRKVPVEPSDSVSVRALPFVPPGAPLRVAAWALNSEAVTGSIPYGFALPPPMLVVPSRLNAVGAPIQLQVGLTRPMP